MSGFRMSTACCCQCVLAVRRQELYQLLSHAAESGDLESLLTITAPTTVFLLPTG